MKRVIIDTDPGIDDAAAILMALGSPELHVEAVTTVFGNTSVQNSTTNALRILEAANRPDIPVYRGAAGPYNFSEPAFAAHIHGNDGLGDANLPLPALGAQPGKAVVEIIDRALGSPGEITLLAIGRLTNLALALRIEPLVARAFREVIVLGGTITVPGNVTPVASANIWGDPEAADVVFRSGARLVQVGLDVCSRTEISIEQQERVWQSNTPASRFLRAITPFIQRAYAQGGRLFNPGGVQYADVLAVAYAVDPSLFECRELNVQIETRGQATRGQTVADLRGQTGEAPNATVALGVDAGRVAELWTERLCGLRG